MPAGQCQPASASRPVPAGLRQPACARGLRHALPGLSACWVARGTGWVCAGLGSGGGPAFFGGGGDRRGSGSDCSGRLGRGAFWTRSGQRTGPGPRREQRSGPLTGCDMDLTVLIGVFRFLAWAGFRGCGRRPVTGA
ncbi:hypothetical protein FB565_001169 [Actinoplanes lutulentus]|nr:hypothetical protein [Actinoplanes lutulentus]